jgi:hypothetical protein
VVIIEADAAPIALIGTLTSARISPTALAQPKEPIPTLSSYLQEPVHDNYPTYKPNDGLAFDSGSSGGYISEGSWGGHIEEDIYRVSDREQEARRLPKCKRDN